MFPNIKHKNTTITIMSYVHGLLKNYCSFYITFHPKEGGVLAVYMIGGGGSDVFFWFENLHPLYFVGPRDMSHIFLGLKICLIE